MLKQEKSINLIIVTGIIGAVLMASGQIMIMLVAPVAQEMGGIMQKAFYLHMPVAWWGLLSFFIVFVSSIIYLIKRNIFWDILSEAAAEVGLLLATLTLITGAIWARAAWNTWWTWDPRLTTALIMWFIYAAYLIVRRMDFSPERRGVISAVLGIAAFIDVPLVFFSTRLWSRTIHPSVVNNPQGGMDPLVKLTVLFCLVSFGFLWASLIALRYRAGMAESVLNAHQARLTLEE